MASHKPIRIGLVGIGRAGWGMHCSELESRKDKFQIVAACDVDKKRLAMMAERYGCATYRDVADLAADPNVELVDVASRSPEHVEHGLAGLKAGKIVFVEKPMSLDVQGARRLVRAAAKAKGGLYVRHNRRFEPAFQHIREILASGRLGEVYEVKLRRNSYSRRDDWQTLKRCGGGQLLNWGPHIIDHGLRFLDSPIASFWSDLKTIAARGDAEDHLKIVMKGENGRIIDLEISGGAAIKEPEYTIFGTKGGLQSSGSQITLRYLDPKQKLPPRRAKVSSPPLDGGFGSPDKLVWVEETIPVKPKAACRMDGIWDHLYASIRQGKPFPIKLEEAVAVMDVVTRTKRGTDFAA